MVADTGFGSSLPVRATDVSEESARKRFHIFKNENFAALQVLKEKVRGSCRAIHLENSHRCRR